MDFSISDIGVPEETRSGYPFTSVKPQNEVWLYQVFHVNQHSSTGYKYIWR